MDTHQCRSSDNPPESSVKSRREGRLGFQWGERESVMLGNTRLHFQGCNEKKARVSECGSQLSSLRSTMRYGFVVIEFVSVAVIDHLAPS